MLVMPYKIKRRLFLDSAKTKKTTLGLTPVMQRALEWIAKQQGQTVPELIVDILDYHLTELVESGEIEDPRRLALEESQADDNEEPAVSLKDGSKIEDGNGVP